MGWILIVEDEESISNRLYDLLDERNFKVLPCYDYKDAVKSINQILAQQKNDAASNSLDVLICDLNIDPQQDKVLESLGFHLLRYVKANSPQTHRVIYTANDPGTVAAKCVGLGSCFFQKTTRPGHMHQNKATIEELADYVYNHVNQNMAEIVSRKGGIIFNHTTRKVTLNGNPLLLDAHELDVLEVMINKEHLFFSTQELLSLILQTTDIPRNMTEDKYVYECMRILRNKLGNKYINARKGLGYSFSA